MTPLDRRPSGAAWLLLLAALAGAMPACSDCDLSITTQSLPDGDVGMSYFVHLDSDCGGDDWFIQTGILPPGIGLQENGKIQGTPTSPGIFPLTVGVFDFGSGEVAYKGFEIEIFDSAS
jgi:hypothetical protein